MTTTASRRLQVVYQQLSQLDSSKSQGVDISGTSASTASKQEYDVIVVGGGICGSSAAEHLSYIGLKVLLIEQFPGNHKKGR
jgi:ribulose 1,5-bisphosphate synthetase/thiazole synthase